MICKMRIKSHFTTLNQRFWTSGGHQLHKETAFLEFEVIYLQAPYTRDPLRLDASSVVF